MEKILLLVVVFILVLVFMFKKKSKAHLNTKRPKSNKPTQDIENDKLIIIKNVKIDDLKQAIQQFCNIYNQDSYQVLPKLTIISENEFVITFPKDIDFEIFCFFVNYLHYPIDISYSPNIKGWATTTKENNWMKSKVIDKNIMLYIPKNDEDFDNVYFTTSENISYKLDFANDKEECLNDTIQNYEKPFYNFNNINGQVLDFE